MHTKKKTPPSGDKGKGLRNLPKAVRNKMGFMKNGGTAMKHTKKTKGYAKGGMKKKGYAKGGMKKKGMARGGAMRARKK